MTAANPNPMAGQPQSPNGELVFDAPWQARTFAMAVQLHQAGLFEWKTWATQLANNIAEFEKHNDRGVEDSDTYYRLWQKTLEQITARALRADGKDGNEDKAR